MTLKRLITQKCELTYIQNETKYKTEVGLQMISEI